MEKIIKAVDWTKWIEVVTATGEIFPAYLLGSYNEGYNYVVIVKGLTETCVQCDKYGNSISDTNFVRNVRTKLYEFVIVSKQRTSGAVNVKSYKKDFIYNSLEYCIKNHYNTQKEQIGMGYPPADIINAFVHSYYEDERLTEEDALNMFVTKIDQ